MKWAILIPRILSEKDGGTKVYVDRFARTLVKRGDDVHIFTTSLDASLPEHERGDGMTIHRTFVRAGTAGPLRFGVASRLTKQLANVDEAEGFDVINPQCAFLLRRGILRGDHLILHTCHAVVTYEYLYKLKKIISSLDVSRDGLTELAAFPVKLPIGYMKELNDLRSADLIVVMSEYVRRTVRSWFPSLRDKKILVSRIGIDVDAYESDSNKSDVRRRLEIREDEVALLTVRRLVTRMGLENLIEAFGLCASRKRDVKMRLFIAGKGPLRPRLERLIRDRCLADAVTLLGFVPDDLLKRYYRGADAFVLPTEQLEGFGIVSIEALASDLPVIATPAGANPEVVGPLCPELMTRSTAPADIADKIDYFVEHRSDYGHKRYSELIRREYSWDGIVDEIESLLRTRAG
jgi:glycosyltransferase involved in cell wall biosynthesis